MLYKQPEQFIPGRFSFFLKIYSIFEVTEVFFSKIQHLHGAYLSVTPVPSVYLTKETQEK